MKIQEIAARFNELAQEGKWNDIQNELFASNAVSIEPEHSEGMQRVEGLDAIKVKAKRFEEMMEEMHGGYSNSPTIGGNHFSVAMGMDVTMKERGRTKMDEIAVYEVRNGKIVKEQFFY